MCERNNSKMLMNYLFKFNKYFRYFNIERTRYFIDLIDTGIYFSEFYPAQLGVFNSGVKCHFFNRKILSIPHRPDIRTHNFCYLLLTKCHMANLLHYIVLHNGIYDIVVYNQHCKFYITNLHG